MPSQPVTILTPAIDTSGIRDVVHWVEFTTTWASLSPARTDGLEDFVIRPVNGINDKMRVIVGPRAFEIQEIVPLNNRLRHIILRCREIIIPLGEEPWR